MMRRLHVLCFAIVCLFVIQRSDAQYLYTVAGGGKSKENLDPLKVSVSPRNLFVATNGDVYFTDEKWHAVRKYDLSMGKVYTIAGGNGAGFSGDNGPALAAQLNQPRGIHAAPDGVHLYIGDKGNRRIRRVNLVTGVIETFAGTGITGYAGDGGKAIDAKLSVTGIHVDESGNIYFADSDNNVIRKIDKATGIITTVAGNGSSGSNGDNGPATQAQLFGPIAVRKDAAGALYITDLFNNKIRKVDASGTITTIAGTGTSGFSGDNGPAASAKLQSPEGIVVDAAGNIYITGRSGGRIRKIDASGIITTIAGNSVSNYQGDGVLATATSSDAIDIAVDANGNIYTAEGFYRLRKITATTGLINTIIGNGSPGYEGDNGPATTAQMNYPNAVVRAANGDLYIADDLNYAVRKVDAATSVITTVIGNGKIGFSANGTLASSAQLRSVDDIALDASNNLYIVEGGANRIRKIDASTGTLSTVAGTGTDGFSGDGGLASAATLSSPRGICVDTYGNIFISDNNRVRKIDAVTKKISTVAGTGAYGYSGDNGPATSALLYYPSRLAADQDGNIYFSDNSSHRIRRIDKATGIITTVAGSQAKGFSGDGGPATQAQLNFPLGVSIDNSGNLYIADTQNSRIRKVDAATGIITTIAGNGNPGPTADGILATASSLAQPEGVTADASGRVYFTDTDNNSVKVIKSKSALITFTNTVTVYNGSARNVAYTTDPQGLNVTVTYNGSSVVPVNAGSYEVRVTSNDPQYEGTAFTTFTVTKAPQVITFDAPGPKALVDGAFDLSATVNSDLPVSYQIADPSVATVSGNHVTLTGLGSTTVTAQQSGDVNHLAAESVSHPLTVVSFTRILTVSGALAFGEVGISKSDNKKITISNNGTASMEITGISAPEGYTVDKTTGQIAAGSSLEVNVAFAPLTEKAYNGKLIILSDATSGNGKVDVTGTGIIVMGIEDNAQKEQALEVYPNPAPGIFYLKHSGNLSHGVQIIQSDGRSSKIAEAKPVSENVYELDISGWQDGVYLIRIPGSYQSGKIIKQN